MDLTLASTSPRRIDLLRKAGLEFATIDPLVNEAMIVAGSPEMTASARAEAKALAGIARVPDSLIMAADTVVVLEEEILDKASDDADVRRMLKLLSGKTHRVVTAVAMCMPPLRDAHVVTDVAQVTFRELEDRDIEWYVGTGEGVGKAGGYAIQGMGGMLVSSMDGDLETVIGMPTSLVMGMLRDGT
jgi:septum formation protein